MHGDPMAAARPLNVSDALTYLDAVKNQFGEQPEVYNRFLDIMKDFKSQNIDTPGVIQRVSTLFHGNPPLIKGFNTFLPAGYHIDTSADPLDNTITVTTPSGTTIHETATGALIRSQRDDVAIYPPGHPPPHLAGPGAGPASRAMTPHGYPHTMGPGHHPHLQLPPGQHFVDPGMFTPGIGGQSHAAAFLMHNKNSPNAGGSMQDGKGELSNIAPAIQYLNKIKSRYADDPSTYKQFLDILQAYQKEQRPLPESQVYEQVQMLFKDAPELIGEFKAFLPEAVGSGGGFVDHGGMMMGSQQLGPSMDAWGHREQENRPPSPPASKKQPATSKSRKKRPLEKEPTPVPAPPPKASSSRQAKKVKHHHNADTGSPSFSPYPTPRSPPPQPQVYHTNAATIVQHGHPMPHVPPSSGSTSADKLLFFDRAKKSLESRETYEDFLKLLSLFSKDIIDSKALIERAKVFLQDENLMQEFKGLIGWDEQMEDMVENGPPGSIRTAAPEVPQPVDDGEGPSYRKLPDSEIRLACSGRDELCRSVLNDVWVSHPTWASEESGFVAHKKNTYEEALHKSEEERHEYHVHIEALTRTIAVLEPLCSRIEEMPPEERAAFKLTPDFGGTAKAIYHRTIRRIYGRDNGNEVIQALQDCPSIAVPVVLTRLKTRDEEWKRAQREFSRSWRDVDGRNFYKSLDHQGIYWKANDKKNITTKHFCGEIETVKNDQLSVQEADGVLQWRHPLDHQLEFTFSDTPVLLDSLKLIYSFMDRSSVQYSPLERRAVDKFLRVFIPCLFNYPDHDVSMDENGVGVAQDEEAAAMHEIMMLNGGSQSVDGPRTGRKSSGGTPHSTQSNGVPASDLRKKLLRTAQEKASSSARKDGGLSVPSGSRGANSAADSRAATPLPESRFAEFDDNGQAIPDIWIREADQPTDSAVAEQTSADRPFFINTTFYTLLRLLQLLYWRLEQCKQIGAELAAQKHAALLSNPIAEELGLVDAHGPPFILRQTIEAMGERGTAEGANPCYAYLLNAAERWFENEMDPLVFEEHMRWFFGTKAYHLFTIDKVIMSLIKQVQTILSDGRCQELWTLFQTAQTSDKITHQDIIRYRRNAEKHVGSGHDDHLFRIQWNRTRKCIRITMMEKEDTTIASDDEQTVSRWRAYLDSYVMSYPTEWLPPLRPSSGPVYLKRTLQGEESNTASSIVQDNQTKIRVGLPSYKLIYESGCEDFVWRRWGAEEGGMLRSRARALNEERRKCRLLL